MTTPQLYPVGRQDFPNLIKEGFVYVDKTMHAFNIIKTSKSNFLSKPRRFGKSLFLSTLESIFLGKKELFKGLYIYDKWEFEKYPIIRISFSELPYEENNLQDAISERLIAIGQLNNIELKKKLIKTQFKELIEKLFQKFDKEVVILIDEYDKPLIDYLNKEDIHQAKANRNILKSFYSILKDAESNIKLLFITGVSKFSKISIFSDLNNLTDLSIDPSYNEICGISQKELEHYFAQELKIYDKYKIKEWYNGYKWDVNGETLYNPFSILTFFKNKGKFQNYWYASGTPTFLMKMCREQHFYKFDEVTISETELGNFDIENLHLVPVLFQTGYLTIKKEDLFNSYILTFPNLEVKESYLRNLVDMYIDPSQLLSSLILKNLLTALTTQDQELLKTTINSAFAHIQYDMWQRENEKFYHAIVHLLFSLMGVYIFSEVHTKNGRSDAIVIYENNIYCIEFKLDKTAEMALSQIEAKGYTDRFKDTNDTIHHLGINFSSEKREVSEVAWKILGRD